MMMNRGDFSLDIKGWLLSIIGITAVAMLSDALLPSGTMKKYVRFVVGIIIILSILEPLATVIL